MNIYKVYYADKWVTCVAHSKEKAKQRALTLFQIKYPDLKFMDTDLMEVEEVSND